MKSKIEIRYQKVSDAKRFFEILNNPNFKYFHFCPPNVDAEKDFLRKNAKKIKNNIEYNYTILFNDEIVGACGLKIDQQRKFIGEIGYFVDEKFWGNGIAVKAVKLVERIAFKERGLKRIEIIMDVRNIASERVAIKCEYEKEGVMKKSISDNGKFQDACLYAKVNK